MEKIKIHRPCSDIFADGAEFGRWGKYWGYHFDKDGRWTRGQVCQRCFATVEKGETCLCGGEGLGQHAGRDILCPSGTQLEAPADVETIIRAGWQNDHDHGQGFGLSIVCQLAPLEIGGGRFSRPILTVAHLSELSVERGKTLARGDVFGRSGSSGNVSGPHVHVQLEAPGPWPRRPMAFEWVERGEELAT